MNRITIDMKELPRMIASSARVCLKAHGIALPDEYFEEIGRNAAQVIVSTAEAESDEDIYAMADRAMPESPCGGDE